MKKIMLGLSLALMANISISAAWSVASPIEIIYAHSDTGGHGLVKIRNGSGIPSCGSNAWLVVSKQNNPMFSEIWSLLLTAYATKTPVILYIDGCSQHGNGGYPLIKHAKTE